MFASLHRAHDGCQFWSAFSSIRPLPCDVRQGACEALVLTVPETRLAAVVALADEPDGSVIVQVRDMAKDGEAVLDVTMDADHAFIEGSAFGASTDEIGVIDTLQLLAGDLKQGDWAMVFEHGEDDDGE